MSEEILALSLLEDFLSKDIYKLNNEIRKENTRTYIKVPTTFSSTKHYKSVFEPLVLEECANNIASNHNKKNIYCESVIVSIKKEGNWILLELLMKPESKEMFHVNDLITLSKTRINFEEIKDEKEEVIDHILGYIGFNAYETNVRVRILNKNENEYDFKKHKFLEELILGGCVYISRITSISTNIREWVAIQNIDQNPFKNLLLTGKLETTDTIESEKLPKKIKVKIKENYNQSQGYALRAGLDAKPIVLIQGPPGTGKTHVILGLLSIILESRYLYKKFSYNNEDDIERKNSHNFNNEMLYELNMKLQPWLIGEKPDREKMEISIDSGDDGNYGMMAYDEPKIVSSNEIKRPKIVVCAPSNSALDEIIYRIITIGLWDRYGHKYIPKVVRIGSQFHHSIESIALDKLVENRCRTSKRNDFIICKGEVIDEADIIGTTLNTSGSFHFKLSKCEFDVVIVDEAAQAVEPSTLIPMMNKTKQVFLVGDPTQLPATVISTKAVKYNYNKSLFKRLMDANYPIYMMNCQYRMHPDISAFPSKQFYHDRLNDANDMAAATKRDWHKYPILGPLSFIHVVGKEQINEEDKSISNKAEIDLMLFLYRSLIKNFKELRSKNSIAIISPYKAQVKLIRMVFAKIFGEENIKNLDINSIDGFQGREKDIILFSAVRSDENKSIGFVKDVHRLNVGMTRAKSSLIIIGNASTLSSNLIWAKLILTAKIKKCMYVSFLPFAEFIKSAFENDVKPLDSKEKDVQLLETLENQSYTENVVNLQFDDGELNIETKASAFIEGKTSTEMISGKSQKKKIKKIKKN